MSWDAATYIEDRRSVKRIVQYGLADAALEFGFQEASRHAGLCAFKCKFSFLKYAAASSGGMTTILLLKISRGSATIAVAAVAKVSATKIQHKQ